MSSRGGENDRTNRGADGRRPRWWGWLVLGLVALVVVVWALGPWKAVPSDSTTAAPDRPPSPAETVGDDRTDPASPADPATIPPDEVEALAGNLGSERTILEPAVFAGIVESTDGAPIVGAEVSCVAILPRDALGDPRWRRVADESPERETRWARSNAGGRFAFADVPPGGEQFGFALWATHPDHTAAVLVLGADRSSWEQGAKLILVPSAPVRVAVVDASGHPVPGAVVYQGGISPPDPRPTSEPRLDDGRLRSLLQRSAETGADGRVSLGAFPGDQTLQASSGELRSTVWTGEARTEVRLELVASFVVEGTVSMPDVDPDLEGERRLTIAAQKGAMFRPLATIRDVRVGPWGPLRLPVLDVDGYVLRLEGTPLIPEEVFFPPPAPGAHLTFDLETGFGETLWLMAFGEDDQGLPDAWASLLWNRDGRWVSMEAQARPDAYIKITGIPAGLVYYHAQAPGYAACRTESLTIPLPEPATITIPLERSARIVGVCLHDGVPVQDFEVVVWPQGEADSRTRHAFHGRESGSFTVEDVPTGDVYVTAASADLPGGEPVRVQVTAGETAEVVLELPAGLPGRGTVLDALDGSPIPDATIQLYYTGVNSGVTRWGPPRPIGGDGRFEIAGFTDRTNYFFVEAPGYSGHHASILPAEPGVVDLGEIRLHPRQNLEFVLTSSAPGGTLAVTGYRFRSHGMTMLPSCAFPAAGTLRFEDVSAGPYKFWVDSPDGPSWELSLDLAPGEEWRIEHRVEGRTTLTVRVVPDDTFDPEVRHLVVVSYVRSKGRVVSSWGYLREDLTLTFPGIDVASARVSIVRARDEKRLAVTRCDLGGREFVELPMTLDSRSFLVRVVDEDGSALPDIRVDLEDPDQPRSLYYGVTDSEGTAEILGAPEARITAYLYHSTHGRHFGIPCDATGSETTLVFEPGESLDLRVLDGAEPLARARCWMLDPLGLPEAEIATDDEGRAHFAHLGPGRYGISVDRHDCWPVTTTVEVSKEGDEASVQMRRLGDVEIEVVSPEGLPLAGTPLALRSIEFDAGVASWIDERRVHCEGGMVTDRRGRIAIEGLPRGRYSWTARGDDGEAQHGALEVLPGERTNARVTLH